MAVIPAAMLLASCAAAPSPTAQESIPGAASSPAESSPAESSPPAAPPAPEESSSPGFRVTECTPEDAARMAATITGQQSAFADADFALARSFASDGFRRAVSVDEFQALIEREYGFLLDEPVIDVERCAQVERVGEVQVRVDGSAERTMIYRLVRERGTWAIDGARITSAPAGIAA